MNLGTGFRAFKGWLLTQVDFYSIPIKVGWEYIFAYWWGPESLSLTLEYDLATAFCDSEWQAEQIFLGFGYCYLILSH